MFCHVNEASSPVAFYVVYQLHKPSALEITLMAVEYGLPELRECLKREKIECFIALPTIVASLVDYIT